MLDRNARVNRHLKANKQTLKKGLPRNNEGANGDITFRDVSGSTQQFVKKNGKWNPLSTGETVKKTVIVSGGTKSSSNTSAGGGSSDHSDLSNLTTSDDHTQYMHNTSARTVTANHSFTGSPAFTNIDINGGDIASGTVINKSPVVNFNSGDVQGSITLSNLASGTGSLTIQPNSVALGTDTTGNYMSNVTGNSQVSVSHSQGEGSTAALSIANDSIGDTQLAYNTGQHLTTSSSPTFASLTTSGDILVQGDDISSDPFSSGFTGSGWKLDSTGHLSVGSATIRGTLSVYELLIQQIRASNGAIFVTSSAKVESASGLSSSDDVGTITFEDPNNNNICPFADGDIIMMQRVKPGAVASGGNIIKKLVYEVDGNPNGKTITVKNAGYNNTSSPSAGDEFVRIGNTGDTANRDGILYLTSDDSNSPFIDIKASINSYSEWNSAAPKVRLGKLDGITDSNAGLNGSQSNLFGLYSDSVYLKGHFYATSGTITNSVTIGGTPASTIETKANNSQNATDVNNADKTNGSVGGWTIDGSAIYSGSKDTSGYTSSNGHITISSSGSIHTPKFYVNSDGSAGFKGTITVGSTDLTESNTLNDNTVWADVAGTTNAPANNATANSSDADLKNRSNHTGTQGVSSLDSTIISGGKIITGLLTADNIQTGTLTGRTVTVTQDSVATTEISPTRTAKSFDGGSNWHNYPNILVYEFTSSGGMDLIAFKATYGYPGAFNVSHDYFDLTSSSSLSNTAAVNVLTRYTNLYPIASFHNNVSGTGWKGWSPDDAYQSIQMLVTDQPATGSNIKQVRFTTFGSPFSSGDYRIIFLTEIYS